MRTFTPKPNKAFTLIELLIVVAIIAILAAIAVPNFLEAQTRSKVSRMKADMRSMATGIETYFVDNNRYPPHYSWQGQSGGIYLEANKCLYRLTTPIAYLTSVDMMLDIFIEKGQITNAPGIPGAGTVYDQDYISYQTFQTFTQDYGSGAPQDYAGWISWSLGPDKLQDAINWRVYNVAVGNQPDSHIVEGVYDPTNGTISRGDIIRSGGEVPSEAGMANN